MKKQVIAKNKDDLIRLIHQEMNKNGWECDLNHIDVSNITDMSNLFEYSHFNGNISKWNTSQVETMEYMFCDSKFNNDISSWNTPNLKNMSMIFYNSKFNGDISKWDVSNVKDMYMIFGRSEFNGNLNDWKPYNVVYIERVFTNSNCIEPYWIQFKNTETRKTAIEAYGLHKELNINDCTPHKKIKL